MRIRSGVPNSFAMLITYRVITSVDAREPIGRRVIHPHVAVFLVFQRGDSCTCNLLAADVAANHMNSLLGHPANDNVDEKDDELLVGIAWRRLVDGTLRLLY
jgi:hypothetical protein